MEHIFWLRSRRGLPSRCHSNLTCVPVFWGAGHGLIEPSFLLVFLALSLVAPYSRRQETFSAVQFGFPFPRLETSRGFVIEAVAAYRPFRPLTHAGTFLLLSALVTFVAFRRRGDIHPGGMASILGQTAKTSLPAAIAFLTLLPLTKAMEGSGQTIVLALGIANFAPPLVYAFMASVVGVLGSFMTSSNLSSNILFGSLQESTASTLGLSQEVILAAQTAGAAVGNAFAPGNVLMAATATGK